MPDQPRSAGAPVLALGAAQRGEILEVLLDSFHDYPVMRFVLGDAPGYDRRLRSLIGFFLDARILRGEPILGVSAGGELTGVALVSDPQGPPSPGELAAVREATWAELGTAERGRYESFSGACQPLLAERPRLHLNMLGVRRSAQGRGIGRRLLDEVHELAEAHPRAEGVSLTTEDERNVPFYEAGGYAVTGQAKVAPELTTWAFFRPNAG